MRESLNTFAACSTTFASRETPIALQCWSLDCLQEINDKLGHRVADAMLAGFALRLQAAVGEKAFVGRLGGEEFVVVGAMENKLMERVLHRLNEHLSEHPVVHQVHSLTLSASFSVQGISRTATFEELLQSADNAIKAIKQSQKRRSA